MGATYASDYDKEKMAIAVGKSLPISTKHCIEIASAIRGKKLSVAKQIVQDSIDFKKAIPFRRFNDNVGHKKGRMASGRYVPKACTAVMKLLDSVEANAQFKGLNTNALVINHVNANIASRPWRVGRQSRRKSKRTHFEVVVIEAETKAREKPAKETKEGKKGNEKNKEHKSEGKK